MRFSSCSTARRPGRGVIRRLVVAPHCDDEVLGCGGLLAKHPEDSLVVVLGRPDPLREKEFDEAQQVLGYLSAVFLDLDDGYVGADMYALVGALDAVVDDWAPQELYLPYPSMHQDHIAAYEAGMRSSRLSMSKHHWFTPTVLVYDVPAYDVILYPTDLHWNLFESLSEQQVDKKALALSSYASQAVEGPHPGNQVKEAASALGAQRQVAFAEQYALVRAVR